MHRSTVEIIAFEPYPVGFAATNRINSYAKMLSSLYGVNINIMQPTELFVIQNRKNKACDNNICYKYYSGTTIISKKNLKSGTILRQFYKLKRKLLTIYALLNYTFSALIRKKNIQFVILYRVDSLIINTYLYFLVKLLLNKPFFEDCSEIPNYRKRELSKSNFYNKYDKRVFNYYDGVFAISDFLHKHICIYISCNKILKIPILVDVEEIGKYQPIDVSYKYIAYCGSFEDKKDGITELINVFQEVNNINKNIKLLIIGDTTNTKSKDFLLNLINQRNLDDEIILTGFLSRSEMFGYLKSAEALILTNQYNYQNQGNFPSRIAEYLSCKVPLITSLNSEISIYLKDQESVIAINPNNINKSAHSILELIEDPELRATLVLNGYNVCINNFDIKRNSKKLISFIQNK